MSIATRFVPGTARPRLDLSGGVVYAPLWRPDLGGTTFTTIGDGGITTHLCTVTGATRGNQGRTFGGVSDKITIPDSNVLDITVALTIIAWIKLSDVTNYRMLIEKNATSSGLNDPYHFRVDITTGYLFGRVGDTAAQDTITGGTNVANNVWHHVAFTHDSTDLRLYVDGVSDATPVSRTVTPTTNTTTLTIGVWQALAGGDGNYWFLGDIGEVFIANRKFSIDELKKHHSITKGRFV